MPDHFDHALPLYIERSPDELRLDAVSVTRDLAKLLDVDDSADGGSFGAALVDSAGVLDHVRVRWTAIALNDALAILQGPADSKVCEGHNAESRADRALQVLRKGFEMQKAVAARQEHAVEMAEQVLTRARQRLAASAGQPAEVITQAEASLRAAEADARFRELGSAGEEYGVRALRQVIEDLADEKVASPETAAHAGIDAAAARDGRRRGDRFGQPWLAGDRGPDRGKDIEVLVQAGGGQDSGYLG
jgi:hypothetical protein